MAKADLEVIGISGGARPYRVAASVTRAYSGEPINFAGTYTTGAASVNTVVVLTDGKPVIGTDNFVGVLHTDFKVNSSGTVIAHTTRVSVPIPYITRIRGNAKTPANVDTDAELLAILWDFVLFDLTSSVYTIDDTATADTSGLTIVDGIIAKGKLDVIVDARAMRADVTA